jgi:hypothetical protein
MLLRLNLTRQKAIAHHTLERKVVDIGELVARSSLGL